MYTRAGIKIRCYRGGMKRTTVLVVIAALGVVSACGADEPSTEAAATIDTSAPSEAPSVPAGFASISPDAAAGVLADPPADLVLLDVRTPEEFAEGHLDGAVLIDFYDGDFADQLAGLDPDVAYLVYCRSDNRSGQTLALMQQLGFASAVDVDGGILAWNEIGLPVVTD